MGSDQVRNHSYFFVITHEIPTCSALLFLKPVLQTNPVHITKNNL